MYRVRKRNGLRTSIGGRRVAIRGCTIVAVEGPQAAGKTALAHALTAALIERGVVAAFVPEPAAWGSAYDRVFLCADRFTADADPFRDRLRDWQDTVAAQLEEQLTLARAQVVPVPRGLSTAQRVQFCLPIVEGAVPGTSGG